MSQTVKRLLGVLTLVLVAAIVWFAFFTVNAFSVRLLWGSRCHIVRQCRSLMYVDCGAAVDLPAYYVHRWTGTVRSTCGGACMMQQCTDCPPPEWDCRR